ncbi:MAG: hypothetical protein H6922_06105 [Pseudomonadaceae bacterium]|nr:hypothetical protein [Pseudomonadaceae bacterium]
MSVVQVAVPIVEALIEALSGRRDDVAKQTGVDGGTVEKVSAALQDYLSRDEKALQVVMAEIDKARQHDMALKVPPVVELLRGIVRPLITLTAFAYYVGARISGVALLPEDYTLIGGIVAFWFGFRSFEKRG